MRAKSLRLWTVGGLVAGLTGACQQPTVPRASLRIQVADDAGPAQPGALSLAGGNVAVPLHIAINITGPQNFELTQELKAGESSLEVPPGLLKIKMSLVAASVPAESAAAGACFKELPAVLYHAVVTDEFSAAGSAASYEARFAKVTKVDLRKVGLQLVGRPGPLGSAAAPIAASLAENAPEGVLISVLDPLSLLPLRDPCTGQAIATLTDKQGKALTAWPLFPGQSQLTFETSWGGQKARFDAPLASEPAAGVLLLADLSRPGSASIAPASADFDGDGLSNAEEMAQGRNPFGDGKPPLVKDLAQFEAKEDAWLEASVEATSPDGRALEYACVSPCPAGLLFDAGTGRLRWKPDFDAAGNHPVQITVSDGEHSVSKGSLIVVANTNRPPVAQAAVSPLAALKTDTLTCSATGSADADRDVLTPTFSWQRNGAIISGAKAATLALSPFARGDVLSCVVTATDPTGAIHRATSVGVTLGNSLPTTQALSTLR